MEKRKEIWKNISYRERALRLNKNLIIETCKNLGLPETIIEKTYENYAKFAETKISSNRQIVVWGAMRLGVIANFIIAACIKENTSIFPPKIADELNISMVTMKKAYRRITQVEGFERMFDLTQD